MTASPGATQAKAVVLNHTGYENHHGCRAVMSVIYAMLAARGVRVIAASPVRHKWWRNVGLMRAVSRADLIVINGEGTLHHGAGHGEKLLQVVDHPARRGAPVVLINALYEENPESWRRYLDRLAFISARDRQSTAALQALGYDAHCTPDFSMVGAPPSEKQRKPDWVGFGDSVRPEIAAALMRLYRVHGSGARLLPIWSSLKHWVFADAPPLLYALNAPWLAAGAAARLNGAYWYPTPEGYMGALSELSLHVTGRFHGMALSLRTRTPFLTATSNSGKNEALIRDAGLNPARVVDLREITAVKPRDWAYTPGEMAAIDAYLGRANVGAGEVFDRLAQLAYARA